MKGTGFEEKALLKDKIDFLVEPVQDLRLEVKSLKQEL